MQSNPLRVSQPASGRRIIDVEGHLLSRYQARFPSFEPAIHQINPLHASVFIYFTMYYRLIAQYAALDPYH